MKLHGFDSTIQAGNYPSARHILAIVLLAGVVRLFVPLGALVVHGNPQVFFQPDTDSYVQTAQSLVEHHRFATPRGPEMQRTPGYPLFLTLGVLADRIAAVTIAAQILLGTATVWLVALLARRVTVAGTGDASRPSIWAATAYALDPLSALYPSLLLTETLFTAVFVVHLLALLRFLETRAAGTAALAGVLAAASTFVRPVAYFWPFVAAAIILCTLRRASVRSCAVFLVLAVLPCSLWAVRNDVQGDYFGFSTVRDRNLYSYNAGRSVGSYRGCSLWRRAQQARTPSSKDSRRLACSQRGRREQSTWAGKDSESSSSTPSSYLGVHMSGIVRTIIDPGFSDYLRLYGEHQAGGVAFVNDHGIWHAFVHFSENQSCAVCGILGVRGISRGAALWCRDWSLPCLEEANAGRDGAAWSGGVFPGHVWRSGRDQPIPPSGDADDLRVHGCRPWVVATALSSHSAGNRPLIGCLINAATSSGRVRALTARAHQPVSALALSPRRRHWERRTTGPGVPDRCREPPPAGRRRARA